MIRILTRNFEDIGLGDQGLWATIFKLDRIRELLPTLLFARREE